MPDHTDATKAWGVRGKDATRYHFASTDRDTARSRCATVDVVEPVRIVRQEDWEHLLECRRYAKHMKAAFEKIFPKEDPTP